MKRKDEFIDVDKMLQEIGITDTSIDNLKKNNKVKFIEHLKLFNENIHFSFTHNGITYYFKYDEDINPYNELVAEELAKDFNIPHIKYDLAIYNSKKGVISTDFKEENINYIKGEDILSGFYIPDDDIEIHNNLEEIWATLEYRYKNHPNKTDITKKLMKRIVDIFMFDIITCQCDRHPNNWQIMESVDDVDVVPIFDNERIISYIYENNVCLTMEEKSSGNLYKNLHVFLNVSSEEYYNLIKDKMWIISGENLTSVFKRIEDKTGYPMSLEEKNDYLDAYEIHREKLQRVLNSNEIIRKR